MNANDLIESYVVEVAAQLPRRQRNDVAFELRALLNEELQGKAESAGRGADLAMATELLQAFGRPANVAARYRPTLDIIDPVDGPTFLRAAVVGLAVIWGIGLLESLRQPIESGWDWLSVLARFWLGSVIPSMWWPGVLVVGFGTAAWVRRRWPQSAAWKPQSRDRIHGGRAAMVLALVGIMCGLYILMEPRWVLDVVWGGRAAPAAYEALSYTESFRQRQAPWLFGLLLLNIPMYITVIAMGRWPVGLRRIETALALVTCAAMAWAVLGGPIFKTQASDRTVKFFLVLITAFVLIDLALKLRRSVKPTPHLPMTS